MKNECKLQLLDLYFERGDFYQDRSDDNAEYASSFQVNYAVNSTDDSMVKVVVETSVSNKTNTFSVNLTAVGIFRIEKVDVDKETYEHLFETNTVAILFPYIRSQISLMTTQPGVVPVIIPPMNINALISEGTDNEDE